MIDLHFTAAYAAAALATAALLCDEAIGVAQPPAAAPVASASDHPGHPPRPAPVRPSDRATQRGEHPTARALRG